MTADEHRKLRRDLDDAVSKMERAAGARDEALQRLKTDHAVSTLERADELLATLRDELEESNVKLQAMRDDFNERWGDRL
jgi:hypothetical protein